MLDRSLSSFAYVVHQLAEPEKWLEKALGNFVAYDYNVGTDVIRYGLTGNGIMPNYIIQEPSRQVTLAIGSQQFELTEIPHRMFNGRTGWEMVELDDLEWPGGALEWWHP